MTNRPLNDKQAYILLHIERHGETSEHRTAAQLERRGLVCVSHKRERCEWNRVVARLTVCCLTPKGERLIHAARPALKIQRSHYLTPEQLESAE